MIQNFIEITFNKLPEAKGVDFISVANDKIAFIEVKNCTGDEGNNRWRITPDNRKRNTTHTSVDVEGRDSLDIEMAQKTANDNSSFGWGKILWKYKRMFEMN